MQQHGCFQDAGQRNVGAVDGRFAISAQGEVLCGGVGAFYDVIPTIRPHRQVVQLAGHQQRLPMRKASLVIRRWGIGWTLLPPNRGISIRFCLTATRARSTSLVWHKRCRAIPNGCARRPAGRHHVVEFDFRFADGRQGIALGGLQVGCEQAVMPATAPISIGLCSVLVGSGRIAAVLFRRRASS